MHDTDTVLRAVTRATTAGQALDAIPESWTSFVMGPDAGGFACSIVPPDASGPVTRMQEAGYAMGRGGTRLEAMHEAVKWVRSRTPSLQGSEPEA